MQTRAVTPAGRVDTTRSKTRVPCAGLEAEAVALTRHAGDGTSGHQPDPFLLETAAKDVEHTGIAAPDEAQGLGLGARAAREIEPPDRRPDEGRRGDLVIGAELRPEKRPPEALERLAAGPADQPVRDRDLLERRAVADARGHHQGEGKPRLRHEAERRQAQVVEAAVERRELSVREEAGVRALPRDLVAQAELCEQVEQPASPGRMTW